jgi:hypothetical protein
MNEVHQCFSTIGLGLDCSEKLIHPKIYSFLKLLAKGDSKGRKLVSEKEATIMPDYLHFLQFL